MIANENKKPMSDWGKFTFDLLCDLTQIQASMYREKPLITEKIKRASDEKPA